MFRATLKLPVETPKQPFIPPASLEYIQPFLKIVGYQGLVDKVSAFFTKNLAQPWQTLFKVFNRCHVDYASLLWWDFIHYVQQKKNVIQYSRFTNLIIADIMAKYEFIPKRLEEEYHVIKDDTPLVNVYTNGKVTVKRMLIPDDLLTDAIRDTQECIGHLEPLGHLTLRMLFKRRRKGTPIAGETSSTRNSLKIRFKKQKLISTPIPPPSYDRERDEIHEAILLSLALHKTAKIAEEQENMAAVEEKILEEDVDKIVEGEDEESYASEFKDPVLLDEENSGTRIEPGSHKDNSKEVDDDDGDEMKDDKKDDDDNDDDDQDDHALIRNRRMGSSEIRTKKMQTPTSSPSRSPRKDLSSDKTIT
ncbi:hypothetical protein Tco_0816589 [Tanacetum coccineum]